MAGIDLTASVLGAMDVPLTAGEEGKKNFEIEIFLDRNEMAKEPLVRVRVVDTDTKNDSVRCTTDGFTMVSDDAGRLPIDAIYRMIPPMIEEIVILNKLMGKAE